MDSSASPPSYCSYCGKLAHGSAACETAFLSLVSFVVVDSAISLVGSFLSNPNPNDIDILVRWDSTESPLPEALREQLSRFYGSEVHLIPEPSGPHSSYKPVYDFVAVPSPLIPSTPNPSQEPFKVIHDYLTSASAHPREFVVSPGLPISAPFLKLQKMLAGKVSVVSSSSPASNVIASLWAVPRKDQDLHLVDEPEYEPFKLRLYEAIRPGQRFKAMKPRMAKVTDTYSSEELWDWWVGKKLSDGKHLTGSQKFDGFRCLASYDGSRVSLWFEDTGNERSSSPLFTALTPKLKKLPSFVLDGELLVQRNSKPLIRTEILSALAGKLEASPYLAVFDLLYWDGTDYSIQPYQDRLSKLHQVASLLPPELHEVEHRLITDKASLASVAKWASSQPGSEGLIVSVLDDPYSQGDSDSLSKIKTSLQIKGLVLSTDKKENGYTYLVGLLSPPKDYPGRVEQLDGKDYLVLGSTFVSADKLADSGTTLEVAVEEIVVSSKGEISFGKPTPLSPDKSRGPYTVEQVLSMAERANVLKKEQPESHAKESVQTGEESQESEEEIVSESPHSRSKCMDCSKPPTVEILWAEGMAHAWFCEDCFAKWKKENPGEVSSERQLKYGVASKRWRDGPPTKADAERVPGHSVESLSSYSCSDSNSSVSVPLVPSASTGSVQEALHIDHKWSMVAVKIPKDVASHIALDGGEPPDTLHITLFFFPETLSASERSTLVEAVERVGQKHPRLIIRLRGTGVFPPTQHSDGKQVLYAKVESPDLLSLRKELVESLDKLKLDYSKDFDYTPHVTLMYCKDDCPSVEISEDFSVNDLSVHFGNHAQDVSFTKEVQEALPPDEFEGVEGTNRSEKALDFWEKNWYKRLAPIYGTQRFIVHLHFRGLSEEESQWSLEQLMKTDHSLHADIRLSISSKLAWWGFTLFTKQISDNVPTNLLLRLDTQSLQVWPKYVLPAPGIDRWLDLALRAPVTHAPNQPGATANSYARFFSFDHGSYKMGSANRSFVEIFLDGSKLRGRYVFAKAEAGGRRWWVLSKPEDQEPYAKTHTLEETRKRLSSRGHEYFIWSPVPGEPILYSVKTGKEVSLD